MYKFFILVSKIFKKTAFFFERLGQTKNAHENQVRSSSSQHDMARHPDEAYYAEQYLHWICQAVGSCFKEMTVLDLACGQGRLTIPMSKLCKQVIGVDFTVQAIESARGYAAQAGCGNVDFISSDVMKYLRNQPGGVFDVIVFTEATFFVPTYKEVLKEIYRVLKSQGMAFISFRSQYFDILHSVQRRKWDSVQMAMDAREGYLWDGATWFSWHTDEDIHSLLKPYGFKEISCVGIGVFSGIEGDPLATIAEPSLLNSKDKKCLWHIEVRMAKDYVNNGRYILAMVRK